MPRKLKPYEVGEVQFRDGSRVPMWLDREDRTFFVEVLGTRAEAPDADSCKRKAYEAWDRLSAIEWRKVIVASVDTSSFYDDGLRFHFEVKTIGKSPAGEWMERSEDVFKEGRFFMNRWHGATANDQKRGEYVLPYSEATHAACDEIGRRLVALKAQLMALLGQPDAADVLAAAVTRMLPAATTEED